MNLRPARAQSGVSASGKPVAAGRRRLLPASRRLPSFGALVLVLEAVAVALQLGRDVTPFVLVTIPAAAAVVVSWASGGGRGVRDLLNRLRVWRVSPRWYLIAVGVPLIEKLIIDITGTVSGLTTPGRLLGAISLSALVVPNVVLVPALCEELGWRGFGAQTALDRGRSPLWAGIVVGLLFITLHVPLYLPGQLYEGMPIWPLPLILLSSSILLTWIYVRTFSVLLAGLMHAAFNATVPLTWGLDKDWVWQARGIVLPLICITLLLLTRQGLLTRRPDACDSDPRSGSSGGGQVPDSALSRLPRRRHMISSRCSSPICQ
jgi:CAAX protease family protein